MGMVSAIFDFCVLVVLHANCDILWGRVLQKVIAQPGFLICVIFHVLVFGHGECYKNVFSQLWVANLNLGPRPRIRCFSSISMRGDQNFEQGLNGSKFRSLEALVPPFESSRRDLHDEHGFSNVRFSIFIDIFNDGSQRV